jgi:hypothetical protein
MAVKYIQALGGYMNLHGLLPGVVAATLLASTVSDAEAQSRRPSGVASLGEMRCENIDSQGPDYANFRTRYIPINREVLFGDTAIRAIAYFGTQSWLSGRGGFGGGSSITLVCQLAPSNQRPRFRNLRLAFGFNALDERNNSYREAVLKFSIYRDGENYPYMSEFLRMGDRQRWNVNVAGIRRIKLEAQCLGYSYSCPGLYFFEDLLQ